MDHREKAYKKFKLRFDQGLQKIAEIDEKRLAPRERNRVVNSACVIAIDHLCGEGFGKKLANDPDLERISENLEKGLSKIIKELQELPDSEPHRLTISWAEQCESERKFKFLGGMGRIFYYFRDGATSEGPEDLDTGLEAMKRKSLRDAAMEYINQADSMLSHITVELNYDSEVVADIRQLSRDALRLHTKLAKLPIDRVQGLNLFHDGGLTILVRQFSYAVSLLCFELYGWINPKLLMSLLQIKAATADTYGRPQWLNDVSGATLDREHRLRKFITAALKDAQKKTKNPDWRSHELIVFYAKRRKRFTEERGLAG